MDEREMEQRISEDEAARRAKRREDEAWAREQAAIQAAEEQALLDNFAMAALTGPLAWDSSLPFPGLAHDAYAMADAMMDQRKRRMEAK